MTRGLISLANDNSVNNNNLMEILVYVYSESIVNNRHKMCSQSEQSMGINYFLLKIQATSEFYFLLYIFANVSRPIVNVLISLLLLLF